MQGRCDFINIYKVHLSKSLACHCCKSFRFHSYIIIKIIFLLYTFITKTFILASHCAIRSFILMIKVYDYLLCIVNYVKWKVLRQIKVRNNLEKIFWKNLTQQIHFVCDKRLALKDEETKQ